MLATLAQTNEYDSGMHYEPLSTTSFVHFGAPKHSNSRAVTLPWGMQKVLDFHQNILSCITLMMMLSSCLAFRRVKPIKRTIFLHFQNVHCASASPRLVHLRATVKTSDEIISEVLRTEFIKGRKMTWKCRVWCHRRVVVSSHLSCQSWNR